MEKVNDIGLGTQQKQQVREGKPVELNVGGEKVSVGLDLKEPQMLASCEPARWILLPSETTNRYMCK